MSDKKQKPQVRWALEVDGNVFVERLYSTIDLLIRHESSHHQAEFSKFTESTGIEEKYLRKAWWEQIKKQHNWKAVRVEVRKI